MVKRIIAVAISAGALTIGLAAVTAAPAQALTCYRAGFDHLPNAGGQLVPPQVWLDDGDPYVESYPCPVGT
ncbi:MAG TPA: hypothetical protein VF230_15255 [Acidimicrobiales bacterium]